MFFFFSRLQLSDRLAEEKKLESTRRKERTEAHLYMNVQVLLEDAFEGHQGNDLYDPETAHCRAFRVKKQSTLNELMELLSQAFVSVAMPRVSPTFEITRTLISRTSVSLLGRCELCDFRPKSILYRGFSECLCTGSFGWYAQKS